MSAPTSTLSVLVVGVGGQGAITAARLLGEAAKAAGMPVRVGQVHGMSQRGGSVESTLVIGPGLSPFLPLRGADIVLGLEPLELLRARPRLHPGSRVVASSGRIVPTPMALQGAEYPDPAGIFDQLRPLVSELVVVDGPAIAAGAGNDRALNATMLGVLAAQSWLPFDGGVLLDQLQQRSPPKHLESNKRAFKAGAEAMSS
jgi:indolepyruvate ferredoxin oxidoreductase beta subunit